MRRAAGHIAVPDRHGDRADGAGSVTAGEDP